MKHDSLVPTTYLTAGELAKKIYTTINSADLDITGLEYYEVKKLFIAENNEHLFTNKELNESILCMNCSESDLLSALAEQDLKNAIDKEFMDDAEHYDFLHDTTKYGDLINKVSASMLIDNSNISVQIESDYEDRGFESGYIFSVNDESNNKTYFISLEEAVKNFFNLINIYLKG